MKKLKSIFFSFCLILPVIFSFVACGEEHEYSEDWTYDATHHWHESICEHEGLKSDYEQHAFGNWTEISAILEHRLCECGYEETRPNQNSGLGSELANFLTALTNAQDVTSFSLALDADLERITYIPSDRTQDDSDPLEFDTTFKYANGNFDYNNGQILLLDGITFTMIDEDLIYSANASPVGALVEGYFDSYLDKDEIVLTLIELALAIDEDSVSLVSTSSQHTLSIDIDLTSFVNDIITAINDNKDQKLSVLLDSLIQIITGDNTFGISNYINGFMSTFNETTDIGDLVQYLSTVAGEDLDPLFATIFESIKPAIFASIMGPDDVFDTTYFENGSLSELMQYNIDLNYNDIKAMKFSDFFDPSTLPSGITLKQYLTGLLDNLLNNDDLTLETIFNNYPDIQPSAEAVLEVLEGIEAVDLSVNTEIVFNTQYQITGVTIDATADAKSTAENFGMCYNAEIAITATDLNSTTVSLPQDATLGYVTVSTSYDLEGQTTLTQDIVLTIDNGSEYLESFSVVGILPDADSAATLANYNATTKTLTISKDAVNMVLDSGYNGIVVYDDTQVISVTFA